MPTHFYVWALDPWVQSMARQKKKGTDTSHKKHLRLMAGKEMNFIFRKLGRLPCRLHN